VDLPAAADHAHRVAGAVAHAEEHRLRLAPAIFYLALAESAELDAFLVWSSAHLNEQSLAFRTRFAPVLAGLHLAAQGESFDVDGGHASGARRFLGWSLGRHWLTPRE